MSTSAGPNSTRRAKRGQYSSIACEECRSRKLKCPRAPGSRRCDRCVGRGITCNMSRPPGAARLEKVEEELSRLRQQVADLTSESRGLSLGSGQPSPPSSLTDSPFVASEVRRRVEPHFVGTTRPVFSLNIAKASLALMGVASNQEEADQYDSGPSGAQSPNTLQAAEEEPSRIDPLLLIGVDGVQRLVSVFEDEIGSVYPVLHGSHLVSRASSIYEWARLRGSARFRGTAEEKEVQLLKVVLATALVLDDPGKAKLGQELFESVENGTGRMAMHRHVDLQEIRIMTIMAIYHFFCDEELYAWRTIGIATRLLLEMGLHRRQSLLGNFVDPQERTSALSLFWCMYALERQWGLGTGLPFSLADRDIDPELPEIPPSMPYLQCLTNYGRLCSRVWEALPQFGPHSNTMSPTTASLLDRDIQNWYALVPAQFRLPPPYQPTEPTSRAARNVRTLTYLRGNHLRCLINRQHVLSTHAIITNPTQAQLVVQIAKDSIKAIVSLSKESDVYARHHAVYNPYLVSALAIVLLAVSHAPALFADSCRDDFSSAIDLVRGFSQTSAAGHRLWKSMCGLVSAHETWDAQQATGMETSQVGFQLPAGWDAVGLRDRFDPVVYSTEAHPDMSHVGVDLMGLFNAFDQSYPDVGQKGALSVQDNIPVPAFGGEEGAEMDQISQFFIGLV
ncbi:putative fungal-specific transcription factor domain protein [Chaetomidium leptoderma]|uniref:Fungal-specific transcription factor domain protein n=1 Tax=Chaetomidium leptoderma TaxID=669021 RepID=A0AAN6ZTX7_9PEZI|nr:putative fungal-specific transcription factor domain protein [Chaetomidium leptoderma]